MLNEMNLNDCQSNIQKSCLSRGIEKCGFHICVLGTIGSGKTTLTHALSEVIKEREGKCFELLEPVGNNPFLKLYYHDPNKYAFAMQIYMLNKRLEQQRIAQDLAMSGISSVQDSSLFGDTCFVEMLNKDGILSDLEVDLYSELFLNMTREVMYPSLIVYLDCDADKAKSRILKRGRDCEKDIPIEYLLRLNQEIKTLCNEFERYTFVKRFNATEDLDDEEITQRAIGIYEYLKNNRINPITTRMGV